MYHMLDKIAGDPLLGDKMFVGGLCLVAGCSWTMTLWAAINKRSSFLMRFGPVLLIWSLFVTYLAVHFSFQLTNK